MSVVEGGPVRHLLAADVDGINKSFSRRIAASRAASSVGQESAKKAPAWRVRTAPRAAILARALRFAFLQATFHKGTREILLNPAFSVQNSLVRVSGSLRLYLAQVNPAGTEFTRLSSTVLKRKPLPGTNTWRGVGSRDQNRIRKEPNSILDLNLVR